MTVKQKYEREYTLIKKHLENSPEPLGLSDLAARTNIKKAFLCVLLNELIQQGQVVAKKIPREGTTLHGFFPPFIWRYTIKRDEPAPEPAPEPLVQEQPSATTERVRTREWIAYDEGYYDGWNQGFEAGKKNALCDIDSAKNVAHADGYHAGYKQGRLDTLEKELPLRQGTSFRDGVAEGNKECRQRFAKTVVEFFGLDTEEKQ